jgi:stringent starvation protein B
VPALPPKLPPKKDVLLALLEQSSVFVHLDPRQPEVRVPEWFKKQPQLILQIGLNLAVPIRDLEVDDEGVSCTLSFSRSPHFCYLPWAAVYAIVGEDGRGMVWPDDVPAEVAAQQRAQVRQDKDKKKRRARPKLRAVGADEAPRAGGEKAPALEDTTPPDEAVAEPTETEKDERLELAGAASAETDSGADGADEAADHTQSSSKARPRPPYLRVVK